MLPLPIGPKCLPLRTESSMAAAEKAEPPHLAQLGSSQLSTVVGVVQVADNRDPSPQPWVAATSRTANQRNCTSLRSACSAIRSSSPCAPRPAAKSASSRTAPNP